MSRKVLATIALVGILITLVGCGTEEAPTPTPQPTATPIATDVIVLSKVSDKPAKKIEQYQPLADYLAAKLGNFGIGVGKVKVAPDVETMGRLLASGEVDLYFDNPYAGLLASDYSGGQPILFRVKKGSGEKHAVFLSQADGGITSLSDLQGQMIALDEPHSASGCLLPLAYLVEAGMNPVEKADPASAVAADEVGYVFSYDDANTIEWVLSGKLAAGAVDNLAFKEFTDEHPGMLAVLAETEPITRNQPGIARPGMDPALQDAILALLVGLDELEEGPALMDPSKTTRFDDLLGEWGATLARVREMYELVHGR